MRLKTERASPHAAQPTQVIDDSEEATRECPGLWVDQPCGVTSTLISRQTGTNIQHVG